MASQAFIDVVADTTGVQAHLQRDMNAIIEAVEERLQAVQIEMEIDHDVAVANLRDEIDELRSDVDFLGHESGSTFGDGFGRGAHGSLLEAGGDILQAGEEIGSSLATTLTQTVGSAFSSISSSAGAVAPVIAGVTSAFLAVAASALAAGAAMLAIPAIFGGIGVIAAAQSKKVKSAFSGLKKDVVQEVRGMVRPIEDVLVDIAGVFRKTFKSISPSLRQAFKAVAPIIDVMGKAFAGFAENLIPVLAGLVSATKPLIDVIAEGIKGLGTALGGFFKGAATGLPGAQAAFKGLFDLINGALPFIGSLLGALSNIAGPIFGALGTAIGTVLTAFQPLLKIFGDLGLMISTAVAPIIVTLGKAFAAMAPAFIAVAQAYFASLQPILAQLPKLITPMLALVTQVSLIFGKMATDLVVSLTPAFITLGKAFGELFAALIPVFIELSSAFIPLLKQLVPLITPVIALVGRLASALANQLAKFIRTVMIPAAKALAALLRGDFSGALKFGQQSVSGFANFVKNAFKAMIARIQSDINRFISLMRNLPSRARAALGNLGSLLRPAGRALIGGFVQGILSALPSVRHAVGSIVSAARNFFPFSPAKEGPFSGRGYTTFSGAALIDGFIKGMESQVPTLQRALQSSLGTTQLALSPAAIDKNTRRSEFMAPSQALSHRLKFGGENLGTPNLTVMIGNKVVDEHVQVIVHRTNTARDRAMAQGIRR